LLYAAPLVLGNRISRRVAHSEQPRRN